VSYGYRQLDRSLNQDFWAELAFLYKLAGWQNFAVTFPETLYTKAVANELSFPLVTHMTSSNIQSNRYEFLKSDLDAEQILDRLTIHVFDQNFGPQDEWILLRSKHISEDTITSFPSPTQEHVSDTHGHGYSRFGTATCWVSGLLRNELTKGSKSFLHNYELRWDYNFFNLLFSLVD
jgi:hypothetical protein